MRSRRRTAWTTAKALVATMVSLALIYAGGATSVSAAPARVGTGFTPTNAGVLKYQPFAPTEAERPGQVNAPLTQKQADRLARIFGFDKSRTLSRKQYATLVSAKGKPTGYTQAEANMAAKLARQSVRWYMTNTTGNTYTRIIDGEKVTVNIGSYGLIVSEDGMLKVPANCPDPTSSDFSQCSPVRLVNWLLVPKALCAGMEPPAGVPCGYMGDWMRSNNARDTLKELYSSAFVDEEPYASESQEEGGLPQLVYVTRADGSTAAVGVPVAPAMWILNFVLVYMLSPEAARFMPAYWAAIPEDVVSALEESENGQVPYSDYLQYFAD